MGERLYFYLPVILILPHGKKKRGETEAHGIINIKITKSQGWKQPISTDDILHNPHQPSKVTGPV
jgi:hypothetical protein